MSIRLRPHHVLCAMTYEGQGYNDAYVANFSWLVFGELNRNRAADQEILITGDADVICAPCPHRSGLQCKANDFVTELSARHGKVLGVAAGDRLSWADCRDRILSRLVPDDLKTLCEGCSVLPSGSCQAALDRQLRQNRKDRPKAAPKDD